MELVPGYHVTVDDRTERALGKLNARWQIVTKKNSNSFTPTLSPTVIDRPRLKFDARKQFTLNQFVWWLHTGQWMTYGDGEVSQANGDQSDYRFENLELLSREQRTQRLAAVTVPAAPDKGISLLPNGQFKVRAYDRETKKMRYLGLRNTREDATELKRQLIAGEIPFPAVRIKPDLEASKSFEW